MTSSVIGIIQVRLNSSRLPGKALLPLSGKPLLYWVLKRLSLVSELDRIIVATGPREINQKLEPVAKDMGADVIFGDERDVLSRFIIAIERYHPKYIVRVNGDNPFLDYQRLQRHLRIALESCYDYVSVDGVPTGLKTEIVSAGLLRKIHDKCDAEEREHVTLAIRRHPEKYRIWIEKQSEMPQNLRMTIDEQADYLMMKELLQLYPNLLKRPSSEVVKILLGYPHLVAINQHIEQRTISN